MSKTPKLRFLEFAGEWEEKELGEVGDILTGKTPSTKEEVYPLNLLLLINKLTALFHIRRLVIMNFYIMLF